MSFVEKAHGRDAGNLFTREPLRLRPALHFWNVVNDLHRPSPFDTLGVNGRGARSPSELSPTKHENIFHTLVKRLRIRGERAATHFTDIRIHRLRDDALQISVAFSELWS